jgi:methyltransferase family protein
VNIQKESGSMSVSDVFYSRHIPRDLNILRAEMKAEHRVKDRLFVLQYLPANSTGAELGVFTGLFSAVLSRQRKLSKVTFVDPWWTTYGECYPDWGSYTDFGRVRTRQAFETAKRRISGFQNRFVEVVSSYEWLESQPDESLDWIYLDTTHSYDGTKRELKLINRKLRKTGLICGDDWQSDRNHHHHGVFLAVNEFIRAEDFECVLCGVNSQWIIRRTQG